MSESLVKGRSVELTLDEVLTQQFYDWERRGRGWDVYSYPVELEPPFRPMIFYEPPREPVFDDARIPSFFSRLFDGKDAPAPSFPSNDAARIEARIAELDEPSVCGYYEEEFRELQLVMPQDQKVAKPFVNQLVTSATYCTNPIAFEIVGTADRVVAQMAATPRDIPQLHSQLSAYFPDVRLREPEDPYLETAWEYSVGDAQIVDFGLSQEFLIPLDVVSNLDLDPLVSVVGALNQLKNDEVGIFQVLFQKVRAGWAREMIDSVQLPDGKPVFANAPEMGKHTSVKIASQLYAAVLRVAVKADPGERVWQLVRGVSSGLAQLSRPTTNELIPLTNAGYDSGYHEQALLRRLSFRTGMILNLDELVSLVHPPTSLVRSDRLVRDSEATKAAPAITQNHSYILGFNVHHERSVSVGLSKDQRTRHIHLVGSSGSGKSTLLLKLIKQDLDAGDGVCVIDPHGDLIDNVIENIPDGRLNDVVLFDPADSEFPVGFNILHARSQLEKAMLSSDLIATFRRMSTSWGDVMDSVLANTILAFVESTRGGTLFELKRFLVEKDFRGEFLETVTDDAVRYFWEHEYELLSGKPSSSILIRLDSFLRQGLIRNIVCQKDNKLDFRSIMDHRKILLMKLSQGLIGEENAYLLGTMLVSRLYQTALSRQDTRERPHCWLYADEFHHFITPSMERILSGTRKYNLGLVLAHQEFRQMQTRSQEVASSVLSNCYTRICFRLGDADSNRFADGFSFFDSKSLQNLGIGEAIVRVERADFDFNLTVDSVADVPRKKASDRAQAVIENSRRLYSRVRSDVEAEINTSRPQVKRSERKTVKARNGDFGDVPTADTLRASDVDRIEVKASKAKTKSVDRSIENDHRYLQTIVKRVGEKYGFVSTIEKDVFGGIGRVDVALERHGMRIACEIAIRNSIGYEVMNIQKCLMSGYKKMAVISPDVQHLRNIRKNAELILSPVHLSRVHFLEPETLYLFLESLKSDDSVERESEARIKGFTVKTVNEPSSKASRAARWKVLTGLIERVTRAKDSGEDDG